jgi:hypothetical protein
MKSACWGHVFVAVLGGLSLAGLGRADGTDAARPKGDKKPRVIQVDLDQLPPELAKQLLAELARADGWKGKDHSRDWHRPYGFSRMPPGIAEKMFAQLPPGIAKKVLVPDKDKGLRYDWSRLPPGIADQIYAKLPPGIAKKVLPPGGGEGKGREEETRPASGEGRRS